MSRRVLPWLVAGCLMAPTAGCSFLSSMFGGSSASQGQGPTARGGPSADDRFLEELAQKRELAEAAPGDLKAATEYVTYVYAAATQGLYERKSLDPKARVQEAIVVMQAVTGDDSVLAQAKAIEAMLFAYLGDQDKQGELLEASYALDPNGGAFDGLIAWHGAKGNDAKVVEICKARRETLDYGDELFVVLNSCLTARGSSSIASGLDFASKGDRAWFESEVGRIQAEMDARRAEEDRRLAEQRAQQEADRAAAAQASATQNNGGGSGSGSTAPSGPVSVTIRNKCRQTVKVFYGTKPKFGSGTYSSMSSNSSTSHSFRAGDMFWIVDDGQNGLGSVTVNHGMREIEILDSCTGVTTR